MSVLECSVHRSVCTCALCLECAGGGQSPLPRGSEEKALLLSLAHTPASDPARADIPPRSCLALLFPSDVSPV